MFVSTFLDSLSQGNEPYAAFDRDYLLSEYNSLIRSLSLLLPESNGELSAVPSEGELSLEIEPSQIRRIVMGEGELLFCSPTLMKLLPKARLYSVAEGKIRVNGDERCTVYYRKMPNEVTELTAASTHIPLDSRYFSLIREWLWHRLYFKLGDLEISEAHFKEYQRLLEVFKAENGVDL